MIPAPASRAPASLRLFLQCASKQYHLPSDFCLSITGPSVSVRCRWHEAHVGNSQLLHRLCGTTGLTFLDQLWALQGINFWPAGAHCGFPGDQNRQNHSIASKSHPNCFQELRKSRFSFGMVAFVETTRSSRSIFQKHKDKRQYDAPARLWDSLGALRVAAGRLKSINFAPQDNPGAVSFGHPMRLLSWFCAPSMARWPVWARTRLLDPATELFLKTAQALAVRSVARIVGVSATSD